MHLTQVWFYCQWGVAINYTVRVNSVCVWFSGSALQLRNKGPSAFSKAMLDVEWPYRYNNGSLLYITKYEVDGAMNCSTDIEINPLNVTVHLTEHTHTRITHQFGVVASCVY